MSTYLTFAILGLGAGALYAALALGLILAHRGAGVLNLGHGAMAMYIAYFYQGLREGQVMIPPLPNPLALVEGVASWFGVRIHLWDWPTFIELPSDLGVVPAFLLSMAMAVVLGLLVHVLIFRPLRSASPLSKTVAATGLALTLQAIVLLRYDTDTISVDAILPSKTVDVFGTTVPVDRFIMLGLALLLAVALMALFRYTRIGIETRAAAENERAAMYIGLSPNRLAAFNWALSSVVAGGVGILFSSITGLNPVDFVLYVIPALGAALLARFTSFLGAAAAGVFIGVLQSLMFPLQSDVSWFPQAGAPAGVPLLVIALAMIIRGKSLPGRGVDLENLLPRCTKPSHPVRAMAVLTPVVLVALIFAPFEWRAGIINSLAGVVLALSLMVIVGMAGQISLMQMAIAGMAAVAMTRLAGDWDLPFPIAPILAVAVAAVIGVVAGLPALRVRGVHLAVLTLGAGYAFENMVLGNASVLRLKDESGSIPSPSLFGGEFGVTSSFPFGSDGAPSAWYGIFVLVVVLLCCAGVIWLRSSRLGLQLLALRANERAATALGINTARAKLAAFAVAAVLAGISGVLSSYQYCGVSASQYVALSSVTAIAVAFIGGVSRISGALVAGALAAGGLVTVLLDNLLHTGQYQPLITGVGLVIAAVRHQEGIAGAAEELWVFARRRLARSDGRSRTGTSVPGAQGPATTSSLLPAGGGASQ
ncbi:MAG: branched-chain amino acid transporter ATPase/permease [Frankiales bacterium]|nr:branched-chain amino acid transporter ATPase/permease [Frankiales bacterium]